MRILFVFLLVANFAFSQGMEMGPLMQNTSINGKINHTLKIDGVTFDSTIIYIPDTLQLPFLDEFSTNKFQDYVLDYNLPGIYNTLHYRLLNPNTSEELPANASFTDQVTFRRYYNSVTSTFSDTVFPTISVKVGDLSQYPVAYQTLDLYPPYYIYDTLGIADVSDTIWITNPTFFQDSARQFFAPINDPSKLWFDNYTYHNYRYGVNPRTLGVVTFDGLDEAGYPYQIGSTITNYADKLSSKPIDLSSFTANDSIYFSFLYQPEGLGDIPESTDSLILEFYAADLDQWFHVWSVNGDTVHPFKAAHLPVTAEKYLKKGFQFRFRNYGSLAGALDHFHLDYVHLRALSYFDDTLFKDFAFVYPLNTLLKNYTSAPWDHYKNSTDNKMTDSLLVMVHNGSQNPENYQNGQVIISQNGTQQGSFVLQGFTLAEQEINFAARTTHTSYHDFSNGAQFLKSLGGNQQVFEVKANASAQFPNLPKNDSTEFLQEFYNYYSYDDGSAEAAFGPTGVQARLAVRYDAYEADSLIGVAMNFVPSVNDVSNKLFLLTIWSENNGKPGEVLYEDDVFFPRSPQYGNGPNQFIPYYFLDTMKVAVGTSFFVGWRQLEGQRLNLGLDRNIDKSQAIKYSVNGGNTWLTSPFAGAAMIRPIFSTGLDPVLSVPEIAEQPTILVYPNPANETINVDIDSDSELVIIYDSYGRVVKQEIGKSIEIGNLTKGIYFVSIPSVSSKTSKFIKL
jgi:hypothetical protein